MAHKSRQDMMYATVVLPVAMRGTGLIYSIPTSIQEKVQVGVRVLVPVGRRFTLGIVTVIDGISPSFSVKNISKVLDINPFFSSKKITLLTWLSEYYCCTLGQAFAIAVPSGFKWNQETEMQFYKERKEWVVSLSSELAEQDSLNTVLEAFPSRAKRQKENLYHIAKLIGTKKYVSRNKLRQALWFSDSSFKALISKGYITLKQVPTELSVPKQTNTFLLPTLNDEQKKAVDKISSFFEKKRPVLLHGVTASGKTVVYETFIKKTLLSADQVLFLVPEIALTTQLVSRIESSFGKQTLVYHSKLSMAEQSEVWLEVQKGTPCVILGTRSALFLPFSALQLIVVDEEHETAYKQHGTAPRYHARDVAVMLAHLSSANIVLGSATPSVESMQNIYNGKYEGVFLQNMFHQGHATQLQYVDLKEMYKKRRMYGHISFPLKQHIEEALRENDQVLLYHNRRGYAPYVQCSSCGEVPMCIHCDVSLSYHSATNSLRCHYCGYTAPFSETCGACGETEVSGKGLGVEQLEREVHHFFPHARVARVDSDVLTTNRKLKRVLSSIADRDIDIIIGTQMVIKGFDFSHIRVIGIMNADNMLYFSDFRAHERSFQQLTQVIGRANRLGHGGDVIVQAFSIDHPILKALEKGGYGNMFHEQSRERKLFNYPPFCKLIQLEAKHTNREVVNRASEIMAKKLRSIRRIQVLGPEFPVIARIHNRFIKIIKVKVEPQYAHKQLKETITEMVADVSSLEGLSTVQWVVDVDPQ